MCQPQFSFSSTAVVAPQIMARADDPVRHAHDGFLIPSDVCSAPSNTD
ncbi:hypothetical protein HMPREF1861_00110 [Corynebacterium kroppenstedtii]|nr:hypothetical protein HMPREF1861_00110 [Corynebacterium kroppenstedtii]